MIVGACTRKCTPLNPERSRDETQTKQQERRYVSEPASHEIVSHPRGVVQPD